MSARVNENRLRLQFRSGASLEIGAGEGPQLHWSRLANGSLSFGGTSQGTLQALSCLANGGATRRELLDIVRQGDGYANLSKWQSLLNGLERAALLQWTVVDNGRSLLSVQPNALPYLVEQPAPTPNQRWRLSPFSYLRRIDDDLVLASPCAKAIGIVRDPSVVKVWQLLAAPHSLAQLNEAESGLTPAGLTDLLQAFLQIGAVESMAAAAGDANAFEGAQAWEFHDLLFHTQSRSGRSLAPIGATYRLRDHVACPPVIKSMHYVAQRPLPSPTPSAGRETDSRSLASVMDRRRSEYRYADAPITLEQLAEFLFRSARITELNPIPVPVTSAPLTLSRRPYPGGGALHPLEVYVVVNQCEGLKPALYHYCPQKNTLGEIAADEGAVAQLLAQASPGPDGVVPQLLIVMSARFKRLSWKYERIAYSLLLKECGALTQNMYLVATDMGLAGCAVGLGDSDLFSQLIGSDYYEETSVGEFALGRRAVDPS